MQYFNIQVASQLSGVASATIRAWEKRYNAVVPERGENKHRLYSESDIEKLSLLFKLTEVGQSIGKIAHLPLEELKIIYSQLLHRPYEERSTPQSKGHLDIPNMLSNLSMALSVYKLDIISHELEKAKSTLGPRELCLEILIPLFQLVGEKVVRKEITIAQEHTLSAIVSFHLGQMIGIHYQKSSIKDELVLITTPEGEMHEIGILASALLCVHYGIRFIFLGPNLPAASLAEAANALHPRALMIGMTRHELFGNTTAEDYLRVLKEQLNVNTEFWIGGSVKPYLKAELEKGQAKIFSSLEVLDKFLSQR
jgi:MerR family transcriptional regulator, light-induced transcriptional regulator